MSYSIETDRRCAICGKEFNERDYIYTIKVSKITKKDHRELTVYNTSLRPVIAHIHCLNKIIIPFWYENITIDNSLMSQLRMKYDNKEKKHYVSLMNKKIEDNEESFKKIIIKFTKKILKG